MINLGPFVGYLFASYGLVLGALLVGAFWGRMHLKRAQKLGRS